MPQPPAEIALTAADVGRLLAAQHPHLAGPVRHVAHGWDNDLFRLGDDLAVRLPRREAAAPLMRHEQRWLPHLAPLVPVPIPVPVAVGVPGEGYPWAWSVVPWFAGAPALGLAPRDRDRFAAQLGGILRSLHVPAPADAPRNPVRGVPLQRRDAVVRERLQAVPALRPVWEAALGAPEHDGPAVWLHGDPHPGNILLGADGAVAALIDFGDLCAGDPASDLAIGWLGFTAAGRAAFRGAVGADAATWRRARGWAVGLATLLHDADEPGLRAMSRHAVGELLGDPR
ncbi:aminoglycoside phosphotransferase family protein [Microbacterium sp. W1N]|uniref:aminoglycoside phosphotransferase family protein n=1 Tax=Microbacterium festucae TaxID=2977531 RepID=UPI0021BF5CE9|nr:aminoglycoside phosphotransferase family protein [Microbacterium festucae]MCT9821519.1 aminoglycoside phosphotransferase family protein [Microbacterium festucae]